MQCNPIVEQNINVYQTDYTCHITTAAHGYPRSRISEYICDSVNELFLHQSSGVEAVWAGVITGYILRTVSSYTFIGSLLCHQHITLLL